MTFSAESPPAHPTPIGAYGASPLTEIVKTPLLYNTFVMMTIMMTTVN